MTVTSAASAVVRLTRPRVRLSGPLAGDPTAKVLHAVLMGLVLWAVIRGAILVPFLSYRKFAAGAITLMVILVAALALWLLRRGSLRAASYVFLSGIWANATIVILLSGGIRSFGFVYYVPLPILAAWLLGFRAAQWNAAGCIGTSLGLALLEQGGVEVPRYFLGTPLGLWTVIAFSIILAAVPVNRILRLLQEALARSRSAQEALQRQEERLGEIVQQRTAELVEARDQAQAASRAKSAFLANMSHELRTPLNAILGFSTLLQEDPGLTEEQRRDLDIINRGGLHLLRLIDGVLDLAKIEAGSCVVEKAVIDVDTLARDVIELMQGRAQEKNLDLTFQRSPAAPRFVCADGSKLRQVLVNLIGNAIKFTDAGSVSLLVDGVPGKQRGAVTLQFNVSDTGIGIAPSDQARIFEPFVQAGSPQHGNGTGLGLAITRQFVEMMGGSIVVSSAPEHGSRFRVDLPVERADEPQAPNHPDFSSVVGVAPDQPDYRILIVDDKPENWRLLKRMLQDAGLRVRVAETGERAFLLFGEWRPDFIWMDMRLSDMDGTQAVRRIRALPGGTEVKIAAITAHIFTERLETVLAAGLDDLVRKPFSPAEVFSCMARHLGIRYLHRDSTCSPAAESSRLDADAVAALPVEVRDELSSALLALDVDRVTRAIDLVSARYPAIGSLLRRSAEKFAYTHLLRALQQAGSLTAKETA